MKKHPFLIATLPRSGSYHLRALLDSAHDIRCYGEIFKGSAVELPDRELEILGLRKDDTEERDRMGMAILTRLRKLAEQEGLIFGFKDFRFNLRRVEVYDQILNSRGWKKVFLFRNPVERYISMERADATGIFVVTESMRGKPMDLRRKITFNAEKFENAMGMHKRLMNDARKTVEKYGPESAHIVDYGDLNRAEPRAALLAFLGSSAEAGGLASAHVKQYTDPIETGVENWDALLAHLRATGQEGLLPAS